MENEKMKIICEYPVGTLRNATGTNVIPAIAKSLKVMPGVGKPFMVFESLPGLVTMVVEWPEGMIVSAVESENVAMINEMLANPPLDKIVI
jgi:hypothetical protein